MTFFRSPCCYGKQKIRMAFEISECIREKVPASGQRWEPAFLGVLRRSLTGPRYVARYSHWGWPGRDNNVS